MAPSITHRTDVKWSFSGESTGTTWLVIKNDLSYPIYINSITGRLAIGKGTFTDGGVSAYGSGSAFSVCLKIATAIGSSPTIKGTSASKTVNNVATPSDRKAGQPSSGHVYYSVTKNYTFTFSGSGVQIPKNTTWYVRLHGQGSSKVIIQDYGASASMTYTPAYKTPSAPTLSATSIVKTGTSVKYSYTGDSNYVGGTERLYIRKDGGSQSQEVSSGAQKAGNFTKTVNPGVGKSVKYEGRKYLVELGSYSSWSNNCIVRTYSNVSEPTFTVSPNTIINGDKTWKITWSKWEGTWKSAYNDTATNYDITMGKTDGSLIYTIKSNATGTTYTITPDASKLLAKYDNTTIRIYLKRKHDKVSDYTKYSYKQVIVRFKPLNKITDVTKLGTIYEDYTGKPKFKYNTTYSDGYGSGICSGIRVEFLDESNNNKVVSDNTTTSGTAYVIPTNKFSVGHTYSIRLTPYYLYNNTKYYGPSNTVTSYLTFMLRSVNAPDIITPTGAGMWYAYNYKSLIRMPTDPNYASLTPAEKEAYKYSDLIVKVNNTTYTMKSNPSYFSKSINELKYRDYVIMNIPTEASKNGSNTIQAQCEYSYGTKGETSKIVYTIDKDYPEFSFIKGEKILSTNYDGLYNVVHNMYLFAVSKDEDIFDWLSSKSYPSYGKTIWARNYAEMLDVLKAIYIFYAQYNGGLYTLTKEELTVLNEEFEDIANILGYSGSWNIQSQNSVIEDIISNFNSIYDIIGMPEMSPGYSAFNFYNPDTLKNQGKGYIGIIIEAMGLAAFVYEMILRMLGLPMEALFNLIREAERECDITYIGPDDKEYTQRVYAITDEILALLVERD